MAPVIREWFFIVKYGSYGPLAQLVERRIRIAEIAGSIPARSTKTLGFLRFTKDFLNHFVNLRVFIILSSLTVLSFSKYVVT